MGICHGNICNANYGLGQFTAEIEYHQRHLTIAKEVGDNAEKIVWYGNVGNVYQSLRWFQNGNRASSI